MTEVVYFLLTGLVVVGLIVVAKALKRKAGVLCDCGGKTISFDDLSQDEKAEIFSHYNAHKNRQPDTDRIFVCPKCRVVRDDFVADSDSFVCTAASPYHCKNYGHNISYLGEIVGTGRLPEFQKEHKALVELIECLRCQRGPVDDGDCTLCKTPVKVRGCRKCKSLHVLMPKVGSDLKYQVLLPPGLKLEEGRRRIHQPFT